MIRLASLSLLWTPLMVLKCLWPPFRLLWRTSVNVGSPFGMPPWEKIRLFFSAVVLDWGEERVRKMAFLVAFDSPKWTVAQEGSQFPLWRKTTTATKNGVISRLTTIHLPKPENLKASSQGRRRLCLSPSNDPNPVKSSAFRECILPFSGGRVRKKHSLFSHGDPAVK